MPGKLVFFVLSLVILLLFAGFNIKNVSDISFGFYELKDVPIFISLLFSFILGIVFSIPLMISSRLKKKNPENQKEAKPVKLPKPEKAKPFGKKPVIGSDEDSPRFKDNKSEPETLKPLSWKEKRAAKKSNQNNDNDF